MGILDEFNPVRDGWSFNNWNEPVDFGWDLYRRTYLAINPTDDAVESPLDVAFFQIFKRCAAPGNCGGMCMLALALYKYGGYMGFCSPASFYAGGSAGPARTDLHQAINIMQGRQFSAPGIRNFLDMVNAGQLNDGVAAWNRIRSGLASGDYCILSLANSPFGESAHTVIPFRAEMSGSTYVLHVWDPDRPYPLYPRHYDEGHNTIIISDPSTWRYDQNAVYSDGVTYEGLRHGWFFAIPTFLEMHKARQPISVGLALTELVTLFIRGVGAAITQIEDDAGRRLYTSDRLHRSRADLETSPARKLPGAARWPWPGGPGGDLPGELIFLERPPGSPPLNISVRGDEYHLMHLSSDRLTELVAGRAPAGAKDRIRLDLSPGNDQSVVVSTHAPRRRFEIHHLRHDAPAMWRSVRVQGALGREDRLRVHAPFAFGLVDISGTSGRRDLDIEFRRSAGGKVTRRRLEQHVPAGKALRIAPTDWNRLSRAKVEQVLA